MPRKNLEKFKFIKNDNVGAAAAEDDKEFLLNCFYDNGDIQALRNCTDIKCIVVGRTGVGKTALFFELFKHEPNTTVLNPNDLSFRYLADSEFLRGLEALNVNLSLFYKLLWKHIICVEMIKLKFPIKTEKDKDNFFSKIFNFNRDKNKERAISYLRQWGESFWKTTEYRVKEVTEKLEADVQAKLGAEFVGLTASAAAAETLSVEQKAEVHNHAQKVIDQIQISELTEVVRLLKEECFTDDFPRYFIVIDQLDEDWVEDRLRYKLIKSLIENARDFSRVPGFKVAIALREDLLERVIRLTRDIGFQEEKYRSFYLPIRWTNRQLFELLNLRIKRLIYRRYTKGEISWKDVFPTYVNKIAIEDYLGVMTLGRPRDLVEFFNFCIEAAIDSPEVTATAVRIAEGKYSESRFRSLADEWIGDYPTLLECASRILKNKKPTFLVKDINLIEIENLCFDLAIRRYSRMDLLYSKALDVSEGNMKLENFRSDLLQVFYKTGLIGLKITSQHGVAWSFKTEEPIRSAEITEDSRIHICPVFFRVLGISEKNIV